MPPISSIGKKLAMAATGQFMILYAIAHLLGVSTFYSNGINAYAEGLRQWPFLILLWSFRLLFSAAVILHMFFGIQLSIENAASKPVSYIIRQSRTTTFAGRTMLWTGLAIFLFLVFHLLHFTFEAIGPSPSIVNLDASGRRDIFSMMLWSFQDSSMTAVYLISAAFLLIHLSHGIQSSIQTLGLNNERTMPYVMRGGVISAVVLFIGYAAIPISVTIGMITP